jgi:hypothetical protein
MTGTSSEVLRDFQWFVYLKSGRAYTVIDLQGRYTDGKFELSDAEFTDTMATTGLLDAFVEHEWSEDPDY